MVHRHSQAFDAHPCGLSASTPGVVVVGTACLCSGRRPGVARRASNFLSLRRKKVTKERATPLSASPALRYGATCGARGRGALRNSLRAGALRSNSRSESVHKARVSCGTRATPPAALLGAHRGDGEPTSIRAIAALGPGCAARGACAREMGPSAAMARRAVRLLDVRLPHPLLAAPAPGRLRGGTRVGARVLRALTRRGCPSGAAQQQSEFHGAPRNRPGAGRPFAKRRGRRLGVAFSLVTFFWRSKRKLLAAGRLPAPALNTGMLAKSARPGFDRLSPNGQMAETQTLSKQ